MQIETCDLLVSILFSVSFVAYPHRDRVARASFCVGCIAEVRGITNRKTVLEGYENVQAALLDYTLTCYPSVEVSVHH